MVLADDRQFFRLPVDGIDDADHCQYGKDKADKPDEAYDEVEMPRDGENHCTQDAVCYTIYNGSDTEQQALVGMEAGEGRIARRKHRDQDQRAEIGKDGHALVLFDVLRVESGSAVCRVIELCEFIVRAVVCRAGWLRLVGLCRLLERCLHGLLSRLLHRLPYVLPRLCLRCGSCAYRRSA